MNIVLLMILLIQAPPRQHSEPVHVPRGYEWGTAELPDPVDVPPITEEYGKLGYEICDLGSCSFVESDEKSKWMGLTPHRQIHSTCADKKRFLMVSEDHRGHCIRLGD